MPFLPFYAILAFLSAIGLTNELHNIMGPEEIYYYHFYWLGRVGQLVGHLTRKSGVLGLIPGLTTYFCFSFRFFKKGSCQLLAEVHARSTG